MQYGAKWIFHPTLAGKDIYCDFYDSFSYAKGDGRVLVRLSADSNYALYINGRLADSGQYADFPHYKVYDELDITPLLCEGENHFAVTVWYYGETNQCYYPGAAALMYEVTCGDRLLLRSDAGVSCRESREYQSGLCKLITTQLGYSFHYDATGDDGWKTGGGADFVSAVTVPQVLPLFPRPIKKYTVAAPTEATAMLAEGGTHFLYDLGRESVGYLAISVRSKVRQRILFAYGEHLTEDGAVPRILGPRDFSVEVTVKEGHTVYLNPFRRLGLRYLEVFAEGPIEVEYITVAPTDYPLDARGTPPQDETERAIYDVAVRTLVLCMHEHYEDCPWREQALYCMDSRNQMLCGYYCFEADSFARASLKLMSEDRREDGLLSITFPCGRIYNENGLVIPSFSLHYFTQVYEYLLATGDLSLAEEIYPKLTSLIGAFTDRLCDGGVRGFSGKEYWNFFEWSDGLAGHLFHADPERCEAALDLLLILALRSMGAIAKLIGKEDTYTPLIGALREGVRRRYFDAEAGIFYNREERDKASELVNALAILADVTSAEEGARIAALLVGGDARLTPITISMLCFKYDALLRLDPARYRDFILADIRARYVPMLESGATSFWEYGYLDAVDPRYHGAASYCHGWSALPVYYYAILHGEAPYSALVR